MKNSTYELLASLVLGHPNIYDALKGMNLYGPEEGPI